MIQKRGGMTDRERIEALLQHTKPDRVPVWPFFYTGFAVASAGYSIIDAYNNLEKTLEAERLCSKMYDWVFFPSYGYAAYGGWEFGGDIKWPSDKSDLAPTVSRYPVETEEDAWNLKIPDIEKAGIIPYITRFNQLASRERLDNEPFNVIADINGPFTTTTQLCGMEKFFLWTVTKPDIARHLLRLATDHLLQLAEYWKDNFGIDGVLPITYEPATSNSLISPKMFEELAFPYIKELVGKILQLGYKHIYIHICGDQNANLPVWAKISFGDPGIISIGHEIDLLKAAEYFPNDIILGNLDPDIVRNRSPQEVYEFTKAVIQKGKKCSGGFIFSPGCDLPPTTPPINAWMMTKAARDFGWYNGIANMAKL